MIDREIVSFVIQRSAFSKFACEALNLKFFFYKIVTREHGLIFKIQQSCLIVKLDANDE